MQTCQREHVDRTMAQDQSHLLHALREFETHYDEHRPHRALKQAAPRRSAHSPNRSTNQRTSDTKRYADETDSAVPPTSTDMPRARAG
ncbi:hypothetical protein [Streptomyces sp. NPDC052107]|uniref:hypothetical protein n=1 Tax=Streptomyces sp. NPDC052107 TaxID=3155632 RepID=UPI003415F667